jgi:hypothetical protein
MNANNRARLCCGTTADRSLEVCSGSFSSDRPAPDARGMSASLPSRPNLRTAANRRSVPQPDSCTATKNYHSITSSATATVGQDGEAKHRRGLKIDDQLVLGRRRAAFGHSTHLPEGQKPSWLYIRL